MKVSIQLTMQNLKNTEMVKDNDYLHELDSTTSSQAQNWLVLTDSKRTHFF